MFGALSADIGSRRKAIGDFDEMIACIAIANGAAIVSRDAHFKRIPGLKVYFVLKRLLKPVDLRFEFFWNRMEKFSSKTL